MSRWERALAFPGSARHASTGAASLRSADPVPLSRSPRRRPEAAREGLLPARKGRDAGGVPMAAGLREGLPAPCCPCGCAWYFRPTASIREELRTTGHAVRLETAGAEVSVVSVERAVTDWSARYFGQWWKAVEVEPQSVCAGPLVLAEIDPGAYGEAALAVTQAPHTSAVCAKAQLLVTRCEESGVVRAVSEGAASSSRAVTGALGVLGSGRGGQGWGRAVRPALAPQAGVRAGFRRVRCGANDRGVRYAEGAAALCRVACAGARRAAGRRRAVVFSRRRPA